MGKGQSWALAWVLMGMTSCSTISAVFDSRSESGLEEVDGLLGSVERAHLECELSRDQSAHALDTLHAIVAPDFRGDAIMAYEQLRGALKRSEKQAEALRETLPPMAKAAAKVAEDWEADLAGFGSEVMRNKSRARLEETTAAYVAVETPLRAAAKAFDVFNIGLKDHVLYLEHDLNSNAVSAIEDELVILTQLQVDLDNKLELCMQAAGDYVRAAALSGQLDMPVAAQPKPEPVAAVRTTLRNKPAVQ